MNKVLLVGRVTTDPQEHTFENGNVKTSFGLATKESYKDKNEDWQETTEFHNIVMFKKTRFQKGDLVSIEGKNKTRSFGDSDNKKYITEVVATHTALESRPK